MLEKILNFFGIYEYAKVMDLYGSHYICEFRDLIDLVPQDDNEYIVQSVWMTKKDSEDLEEFTGF